jgi:hypothetical protein
VDPVTGDILLVAKAATNILGNHGLAFLGDGTRVYVGNEVLTVGPASIAGTTPGSNGPDGQVVGDTLFALIGGGQTQLRTYSLADPDLPVQIATTPDTPNRARGLALFDGGALIVVSGFGGMKSYVYDPLGMTILPAVGIGDTEFRDGGNPFPTSGVARVYRTISANAAGDQVAAAYFTNDPDAGSGGVPPSGVILLDVAADGTLTLAGDFPLATYARVTRFIQRP